MTRMGEAVRAIRAAMIAEDLETIKTLRAEYNALLFTYNPNRPTTEERAFEAAMQDADGLIYPRESCGVGRFAGRHMDDCMRRCLKEFS